MTTSESPKAKSAPAEKEVNDTQSRLDLESIMRDLREANENLVIANLRSIALASQVGLLYEEATETIAAKNAFFEQISHELRTPMTSISGWADLLGIKSDPETISEAAQSIAASAAVQAKLVNDLLDVSRIMTHKFGITATDMDFSEVVNEAAIAFRPSLRTKGTLLKVDLPGAVFILGDPIRLRQVLDNLLSNALKFTPPGGLIEVSLSVKGCDTVLEVRDNGEGIRADFLPHVFTRHAQASAGRFGGLGLGLAIVKHIVELHGGTVAAESAGENMGTLITVRIPEARIE